MAGRHFQAAKAMTDSDCNTVVVGRQQLLCTAAIADAAEQQAAALERIADTLYQIYQVECTKL